MKLRRESNNRQPKENKGAEGSADVSGEKIGAAILSAAASAKAPQESEPKFYQPIKMLRHRRERKNKERLEEIEAHQSALRENLPSTHGDACAEVVKEMMGAIEHGGALDKLVIREVVTDEKFVEAVENVYLQSPFEESSLPTFKDESYEELRSNLVAKLNSSGRVPDLSAQDMDIIISTMVGIDWLSPDQASQEDPKNRRAVWSNTTLPNPKEAFFSFLEDVAKSKVGEEAGEFVASALIMLTKIQTTSSEDSRVPGTLSTLMSSAVADEYVRRYKDVLTQTIQDFRTEAERILTKDRNKLSGDAFGCGLSREEAARIIAAAQPIFIRALCDSDSFTEALGVQEEVYGSEASQGRKGVPSQVSSYYVRNGVKKILQSVGSFAGEAPPMELAQEPSEEGEKQKAELTPYQQHVVDSYNEKKGAVEKAINDAELDKGVKTVLLGIVEEASGGRLESTEAESLLERYGSMACPLEVAARSVLARVIEKSMSARVSLSTLLTPREQLMLVTTYERKPTQLVHADMKQRNRLLQKIIGLGQSLKETRVGKWFMKYFGWKIKARHIPYIVGAYLAGSLVLNVVPASVVALGLLTVFTGFWWGPNLWESSLIRTIRRNVKEKNWNIFARPWAQPAPVARADKHSSFNNTKGKRGTLQLSAFAAAVLSYVAFPPFTALVDKSKEAVEDVSKGCAGKVVGRMETDKRMLKPWEWIPLAWKTLVSDKDSLHIETYNPKGWHGWNWEKTVKLYYKIKYGKEYKSYRDYANNPYESPGTRHYWRMLPKESDDYYATQFGVVVENQQKWLRKHIGVLRALQEWSTGRELVKCEYIDKRVLRELKKKLAKEGGEKVKKQGQKIIIGKDGQVTIIRGAGEDKAAVQGRPQPRKEAEEKGGEVEATGRKVRRRRGRRGTKAKPPKKHRHIYAMKDGEKIIVGEIVRVGRGIKLRPVKKSDFPYLNIVKKGGTPVAALCTAPVKQGYRLAKRWVVDNEMTRVARKRGKKNAVIYSLTVDANKMSDFIRELQNRERKGERIDYDYMQKNLVDWSAKGWVYSEAGMKLITQRVDTLENISFLLANSEALDALKPYLRIGDAPQYLVRSERDGFVTAWRNKVKERLESNENFKRLGVSFDPGMYVATFDSNVIADTFNELRNEKASAFRKCEAKYKFAKARKEMKKTFERIGKGLTLASLSKKSIKTILEKPNVRRTLASLVNLRLVADALESTINKIREEQAKSKDTEVKKRLTNRMAKLRKLQTRLKKSYINPRRINVLIDIIDRSPAISLDLLYAKGCFVERTKRVKPRTRKPATPQRRRRGRRRRR